MLDNEQDMVDPHETIRVGSVDVEFGEKNHDPAAIINSD